MTPVEDALRAGHSQDDINAYLADKTQQAKALGYSDQEIQGYVKDSLIQQPAFNDLAIEAPGRARLSTRPAPKTVLEAVQTGWDWSTLSLGKEALKAPGVAKLPDMAVDDTTPWNLRIASTAATLAGDVPAMMAGGLIGGAAGGPFAPITAWGGAGALPMGLRKVFIDAINEGSAVTKQEVSERVLGTVWETIKGYVVGATTATVGKFAGAATSALPKLAQVPLIGTAEWATMSEVAARVEGHAPTPESLIDNALLLGVMKAVLPSVRPAMQARTVLQETYVKTGIPPEHVTQDALKGTGVWQDLLDGRVPEAYKAHVEQEPSGPTQTQRTEAYGGGEVFQHQAIEPIKELRDDPMWFAKEGGDFHSYNDVAGTMKATLHFEKPFVEGTATPEEWKAISDKWKANGLDPQYAATFLKDRQEAFGEHMLPGLQQALESLGYDAVVADKTWRSKWAIALHPKKQVNVIDEGGAFAKAQASKPLTPEQQAQAQAFFDQPFAEIPQMPNEPSRPTHINYNYIDTPEQAKETLSRLSQIYEGKIQEQQGSPRSWVTSHEEAAKVLSDLLQSDVATVTKFLSGAKADPSTTAQLLARKELAVGFTEDLMRTRAALAAKGDAATPEEMATFLAQVERVSTVQAGFLGQRADVGRALNALKSTTREADRSQAILDALNSYGGPDNVPKLVKMLGEFDHPAQAMKFAREATKATTWEKVIEAWKSGLVSGLRTNEVNFLSTLAFTTLKLPVETMSAVFGSLSRTEQRVMFSEIPARIIGMAKGAYDGLKVAGGILRSGEDVTGAKTDTQRTAIPGTAGEMVRLPFRTLAASDALLSTMNSRGELYALATRTAIHEGQTFGSPAFWGRVVDLAQRPTQAMTEASEAAALRYTFRTPLGPGGKSFQQTVRNWPILQLVFPFTTTPGNIFKETARMTPGMNFAVKEWRDDYAAGGARKDRALAEVAVGAAIMSHAVLAALNGAITGGGSPDKAQRETDRAAGWKPYAFKINGHYIDGYLRMAPIGPLIGLAADGVEFARYMTHDERDKWARMLAFALAQNVTNQTMLTGAVSLVNVMQDPERYGENYFEALAGSAVPGVLAQYAAERDPLLREIHGMRDAVQARIPFWREGLMPKHDFFGTTIANPERLWWGSPFSTTPISTDKVRTESARLGFTSPKPPSTVDVIPGKDFGKIDKVKLTPEQKDIFTVRAGQLAYEVLSREVHTPEWDRQPPMVQRRFFEEAFKAGRERADKETFERIIREGGQAEVLKKVTQALQPVGGSHAQ